VRPSQNSISIEPEKSKVIDKSDQRARFAICKLLGHALCQIVETERDINLSISSLRSKPRRSRPIKIRDESGNSNHRGDQISINVSRHSTLYVSVHRNEAKHSTMRLTADLQISVEPVERPKLANS
jgi:hypothetical protein